MNGIFKIASREIPGAIALGIGTNACGMIIGWWATDIKKSV